MASFERIMYQWIYPFRRIYWYVCRPRTQSVKCLFECDGHFLFIRNTYGKKYWTFPGGRVKTRLEESPKEAAVREAREEVGIDFTSAVSIGEYYTTRRNRRDTVCCFYAQVCNAELKLNKYDILEARWFSKETLPQPLSFSVPDVLQLYKAGENLMRVKK